MKFFLDFLQLFTPLCIACLADDSLKIQQRDQYVMEQSQNSRRKLHVGQAILEHLVPLINRGDPGGKQSLGLSYCGLTTLTQTRFFHNNLHPIKGLLEFTLDFRRVLQLSRFQVNRMKDYSQITDALLHGILVFDGPIQCPSGARHVAADSVGAGNGEWVLVVTGSSARKANGGDLPIDLSVIGIVDQVVIEDQVTYRK